MPELSFKNKEHIRLAKILTWSFFRVRYIYRLSDFSYGEWIIFENTLPKYYLNILTSSTQRFLFRKLAVLKIF